MALYTSTAGGILAPEQIAALLVEPALAAAIATDPAVSTVVSTLVHAYRIPRVTTDPAAGWVNEGAEIAVTDAGIDEVTVVPAKLAGLCVISSELADDSSPQAAEAVGAGLARDLARRLDEAFVGDLAAPAPAGLASLTGVTVVTAPSAYIDVDPFEAALSAAATVGATLTAWVTSPADALELAQVKEGTTSVRHLLTPDPSVPTRRTVAGLPLLISPYAEAGVVWGIPADRVTTVVRQDAEVTADGSPYFTSDRVALRGILRAAFGFPHEAAIVKIAKAA